MTTFFSVDVETTATSVSLGHLLTVGVAVVCWEPGGEPMLAPDRFYARVDIGQDNLHNWAAGPGSSLEWWEQQDEAVQGEAFRDRSLVRHSTVTAASMLYEFVACQEADVEQRIFVANPVAFDKPWIDELFDDAGLVNPFHYRSLCLRSMKFGLREDSAWGGDRETRPSRVPHHALWDAIAQAEDLIDMLTERDGRGRDPRS